MLFFHWSKNYKFYVFSNDHISLIGMFGKGHLFLYCILWSKNFMAAVPNFALMVCCWNSAFPSHALAMCSLLFLFFFWVMLRLAFSSWHALMPFFSTLSFCWLTVLRGTKLLMQIMQSILEKRICYLCSPHAESFFLVGRLSSLVI